MKSVCCATMGLVLLLTMPALAQPVLDGDADEPLYGAVTGFEPNDEPTPLIVQDGQTGYGDSNIGRPNFAAGSELDSAYGVVYGDTLYLTFAGNFETSGNRLHVFFDTRAYGQQQLDANNPDKGVLLRLGPGAEGPGLKFKSGFEADFWLSVNGVGDPVMVYADFAELYDDVNAPTPEGWYVGAGEFVCGGEITLTGGDPDPPAIQVALDNRNVAGVSGGFDADYGAGVTTGFELAIPLSALDSPAGAEISIVAFIGSSDGSSVSNQVLGGLGGILLGNIAGGMEDDYWTDVRLVDFTDVMFMFHSPFTVSLTDEPVGACCVGEICTITTQAGCGGTYLGDNTNCDGNPCDTIPSGRCCIDDGYSGLCEVMSEADCLTAAGTWTAGEDCAGCPCLIEVRGACCVDGDPPCVFTTQKYCEADPPEGLGGDYAGNYTHCDDDPDPCGTGACCIGQDCYIMRQQECWDQNGNFFGIDTECPEFCYLPSPHVAGTLNGWAVDGTPMTEMDPPNEGIWTATVTGLTPDNVELFKITDGVTWNGCLPTSGNSFGSVDEFGEITITYDTHYYEGDEWLPTFNRIGVSLTRTDWVAVGSFQSEVGGFDWDPDSDVTVMTETEPGIWMWEATGIPAAMYWGKCTVYDTWDAVGANGRSVNADNAEITIDADTDTLRLTVNPTAGLIKVEVIPAAPPICLGDSNCDGEINWRDIDYFVAAQNDNETAWEAMFLPGTPSCLFANNDVNEDGTANWRDIDPFVAVMNTTCP
ncbi:MAG: hypothetical protein KAY37_01240 [Phycisphaerae bacterium]|nr:hypothetical protein [Phycisphaerae bacterium]